MKWLDRMIDRHMDVLLIVLIAVVVGCFMELIHLAFLSVA